jgi:hypothetical protein
MNSFSSLNDDCSAQDVRREPKLVWYIEVWEEKSSAKLLVAPFSAVRGSVRVGGDYGTQ